MTKIIYTMSMSLDGFVTAAEQTADEPLGAGGERLHQWAYPPVDPDSDRLVKEYGDNLGSMITGRNTYDQSLRWWGPDGPAGEERTPVFVVTHRADPPPPDGSVYTFVGDVDSAVEQARAAAGGKNIGVSGVEIGRRLLEGGHVDEIWIPVVPVLFGDGMRLFERPGTAHLELELIESVSTPDATHLRYRVGHQPRK